MQILGLTQNGLAEMTGVGQTTINRILSGQILKTTRILELAKALKCDPDWLLYGDDKKSYPPASPTTQPANETAGKYWLSDAIALDFYDVDVSAGHGALVMQEDKSGSITFSRQFLDETIGVNAKNVFLMPVRGDSMYPTLKNQAIVMVSKVAEFAGDGIYVFRYDSQLMVKRLQFSKTGLTVASDNSSYKEWELTRDELATEDFEIIGEVVWSGQRM